MGAFLSVTGRFRKVGTAGLLLSGMILAGVMAPPALANNYEAVVRDQLTSAAQVLRAQGFTLVDTHVDRMNANSTDSFTIALSKGVTYNVLAVCDQDCSDIDLQLVDSAGDVVEEDMTTDDIPMVLTRAVYTGEHTIKVQMYNCSNSPCFYGVAVYRN
ncbi:MAG: hypothetical protein RLY86_1307 [Pseudomonadota bacterium]|jgi:hypothetical protein